MASFGVSLRRTSSSLLGANQATSDASGTGGASGSASASAAAAAAAPMVLHHCSAGGGVTGESVALLCAMLGLALQRREHTLMLGAPPTPSSALPGAMAAAAAAASDSSTPASASLSPSPSSLPMLVDGDTAVSGWVSCLKYAIWKAAQSHANGVGVKLAHQLYPPPFSPSPVPSVTSFAVDSAVEWLLRSHTRVIDPLCDSFTTEALRAGHAGQLPFLSHRFDREGDRLVPRWGAARSAKAAPAYGSALAFALTLAVGPGAASGGASARLSPSQALEDPQVESHALERNVRALQSFVDEMQEKLRRVNPAVTTERALQIMRDTDPLRCQAAAAAAASAAAGGSAEAPAAGGAASQALASDFLFLLGTAHPTLADFVAFALLARLSLLHSFLPALSPQSHPHLFAFGGLLGRLWSAGGNGSAGAGGGSPGGFDVYSAFAPVGLDGARGRHVLLCRHPILRVHDAATPPPSASAPASASTPPTNATPAAAPAVAAPAATSPALDTVREDGAAADAAASFSRTSTIDPSSSSCGAGGGGGGVAPPTRLVPRLTNAAALDSSRVAASSLAVEDVPDLMDYVDKLSVRARAVTPAGFGELAPRVKPVPPAGVASSAAATAATAATASSLSTPPLSSLAWSKILSERLLHAVDHAPLGWRVLHERGRVRTAVPVDPCPEPDAALAAAAAPSPSSYHYLCSTVLPVSAPVLLAFLWSPDCHRVLDGSGCTEARELAPHPLAPTRARYAYLQLELRATSAASAGASGGGGGSSGGAGGNATLNSTSSTTSGRRDTDASASASAAAPLTPFPSSSPSPSPSFAPLSSSPSTSPSPAAPPAGVGGGGTATAAGTGAATGAAAAGATKTSSARVDFVLLNSWRKRLDGSYALLSQSVPEECMGEINAPKKFGKGCIRGSVGGPDAHTHTQTQPQTHSAPASASASARALWLASTCGASGWVLRPVFLSGSSPGTEVTFLCRTVFPARMGAWVAPAMEKRAARCVDNLRAHLRAIMAAHPLVQLRLGAGVRAEAEAHRAAAAATAGAGGGAGGGGGGGAMTQSASSGSGSGSGSSSVSSASSVPSSHSAPAFALGGAALHGRAPSGTVHFRLTQPVPASLVHAVSGHGVQSTPHPRARG